MWRSRLKANSGIEEDASPGFSHGQGLIRALAPVREPWELSRNCCHWPDRAALAPSVQRQGPDVGRDGALRRAETVLYGGQGWSSKMGRDGALRWAGIGL